MTEEAAYELFRRAITERDADAWAAIHAHYRPLLMFWASRVSAQADLNECYGDIADRALARAWAALTSQRCAAFDSLARLLSYLRTCVTTTLIDSARAQESGERVRLVLSDGTSATPEQIVLAEFDRNALWRVVSAVAANSAERIMLVESFVYGLPPRAICLRHPEFFPDVTAVYTTKRNLLDRLRRNRELLQLRESFISPSVCS
jgi:DNA-directed RNA polymerase specialized sigma24 family protein